MARSDMAARPLAGSHGFTVAAEGISIGSVETPVFPETGIDPDYLVVRTSDHVPGTFRIVPATLIERVDAGSQLVVLAIGADAFAALPERLVRDRSSGR